MRIILAILFIPVVAYLLFINVKFYYSPDFKKTESGFVNSDLSALLASLKNDMKTGAAREMQGFYPEGFVFMNSLYGLAVCNHLKNSGGIAPPYQAEALYELRWIKEQLYSEEAKGIFDKNLPLEYGAFYNGWTAYFEANHLAQTPPAKRETVDVDDFQAQCNRIAKALNSSESPWLESYHLSIWPADNVLCIAALKLHDELFDPVYQQTINDWLLKVRRLTDPATGLIPHSVHPEGTMLEGPRGSSQSLMLTFLPTIDSSFAKEQFALFQKHFVDDPLGLVSIREYPFGTDGNGDVDAGPVIFGMGGAASIVGIATFRVNGNLLHAYQLRNEVEGLLVPISFQNDKFYCFGAIPMVDAFLAWAHSFQAHPDKLDGLGVSWKWFHLITLMLLGSMYWVARIMGRKVVRH